DLRELDRVAQELMRHRIAVGPEVAAAPVGILEEDRGDRAAAAVDGGGEHLPGLGAEAAGLPDVLVQDAEVVSAPEVAREVEIPTEDVGELGHDTLGESGTGGILLEAPLDPARG